MLKPWISITLTLLCDGPASAQPLNITVRVSNQANVPRPIIVRAEREAAYVLGTAAVEVNWVDCGLPGSCLTPLSQLNFEILIRKRVAPSLGRKHGAEAMGLALLPLNEPGCYVLAYYGEIQHIAENSGSIAPGELLGYVIAHEIGHLLLGPQHVPGTVMKGEWNESDLRSMAKREIHFDNSQRSSRSAMTTQNRTYRDQVLLSSLLR